ncbi:MAG: TlpA family protein disulfide reductase [Planctomycetes bacterium]|nr:TlpA family protein disulfide reductase [Planctomycetota bacterium]
MRQPFRYWILAVTIGLTVACLGCGGDSSESSSSGEPAENKKSGQGDPRPLPPKEPWPDDPVPPAAEMPKTNLSDEHKSTCRVLDGDLMPMAPLSDLAGNPVTLKDHLGAKGTVVFFWSSKSKRSLEELTFIRDDVGKPEDTEGIVIIGINTGETAEEARKRIDEGVDFVNLLDTDGAFFAAVATEQLSRTYVLDSEGRIRWLDLEYAVSTHRDVKVAVRVLLAE